MNKIVFLSLLYVLVSLSVSSETLWHYNTSFNSFQDYGNRCALDGKYLLLKNQSDKDSIVLSNRTIDDDDFKLMVRLSNQKAKTVSQTIPACGLVLFYADEANYYTLEMVPFNTVPHDDMRDERLIKVSLCKVENGHKTILSSKTTGKNVNLYDGLNTLCADFHEGTLSVSVGDKRLHHLFTFVPITKRFGLQTGLIVSKGGKMKVERTVLSLEKSDKEKTYTEWTKEKLITHFRVSKNPFEGFWEYLDRDMDDGIARIGGKYTLALVETNDGFDIIYISGAQVGKREWKEGMLKGKLYKTIFTDNYKARWADATFRILDDDVNGYFESGLILDMSFPTLKSKIRFSKVLK